MADPVEVVAENKGSDLYHQMLAYDYGDEDRRNLMEKVWSVTPWIINAHSGPINSDSERRMITWCRDVFGGEAWPIHNRSGEWQRGSATVYGWTWFGFRTADQLSQFEAMLSAAQVTP